MGVTSDGCLDHAASQPHCAAIDGGIAGIRAGARQNQGACTGYRQTSGATDVAGNCEWICRVIADGQRIRQHCVGCHGVAPACGRLYEGCSAAIVLEGERASIGRNGEGVGAVGVAQC